MEIMKWTRCKYSSLHEILKKVKMRSVKIRLCYIPCLQKEKILGLKKGILTDLLT